MKCDICLTQMSERMATVEDTYLYDMISAKDVYLSGILVRTCPKCHVEVPVIPRIEDLHRTIASAFIQQPTLLRGDQIKFLRKEIGFPSKKFARLLGVTPFYLSKIENGKIKKMGEPSDRLVRVAVANVMNRGEEARQLLLRLADQTTKKKKQSEKARIYERTTKGWRIAA